jgi:hypothetical protein
MQYALANMYLKGLGTPSTPAGSSSAVGASGGVDEKLAFRHFKVGNRMNISWLLN